MGWTTPKNPSSNCISSCFGRSSFVNGAVIICVIVSLLLITYGCFRYGEEAEVFDKGAQGNFHFLHGESHADAVARSHSEWHENVRAGFDFTVRVPPVFVFPPFKINIKQSFRTL